MTTAIITGVSGQDGFYAAQLLLERGYRVVGTVRSADRTRNSLQAKVFDRIELVEWDLKNQRKLVDVLTYYRPSKI